MTSGFQTAFHGLLHSFRPHASRVRSRPPARRVVYTCLFGASEPFLDLRFEPDGLTDYICFTDDESLRSDVWTFVQAPRSLLDPHRRAKGFKHRPHLFFPDHAQSLYMDNTVRPRQPPEAFFALLDASEAPMLMFAHHQRQCVYAEAEEVKRVGYDSAERVDAQMRHYRDLGYPRDNGLHASTVMARRHHDPRLRAVMDDWYAQVLRYSRRDQLSFNVVRHFHGLPVGAFEGTLLANDLLQWPAEPDGQRLPRDFEDAQYLRLHPDVAAAGVCPRRHFLAYGMAEGRAYKLPPCDTPARAHPALSVDAQDERGRELLRNQGHLNRPTFDIWVRLLKERAWTHVIDVGANYGEMLLDAPLPDGATLVAFEPNARIFPHLAKNLARAGIECDCRLEAVCDQEGFAQLGVDLHWSGLTRLLRDDDEGDAHMQQRTVWATTLAALLAQDARPGSECAVLLKIDVEGGEAAVLQGLGDWARFASFAALVEILHLGPADMRWILGNFDVELLDPRENALVRVDPPTPERLEFLVREAGCYANDAVVRRKTGAEALP